MNFSAASREGKEIFDLSAPDNSFINFHELKNTLPAVALLLHFVYYHRLRQWQFISIYSKENDKNEPEDRKEKRRYPGAYGKA